MVFQRAGRSGARILVFSFRFQARGRNILRSSYARRRIAQAHARDLATVSITVLANAGAQIDPDSCRGGDAASLPGQDRGSGSPPGPGPFLCARHGHRLGDGVGGEQAGSPAAPYPDSAVLSLIARDGIARSQE